MPRVPRWMQLARDAAYHVMTRGHNREALFADTDDTRYFLGLLDRYRRRFSLRLYHYCLLTNHIHLLLELDDPRRLSALMAGVLIAYVRYCNARHGFVGQLVQGRFKSPLVQRQGYWLSCGRYIERNPLGRRSGGGAVGLLLVELPRLRRRGGGPAPDRGPLLHGVEPGCGPAPAAVAGVRVRRRPPGRG
jgi:REP element-mobilizing transposase RayT